MLWVVILAWLVNFLLLRAASRLLGEETRVTHLALGALIGALGVALSLLPDARWLHAPMYRWLLLTLMCLLAYGIRRRFLMLFFVFALLHFSVGGLSAQINEPIRIVLGAVGIGLASFLAGREKNYVPVEINYHEKSIRITALFDTGNMLRDPITGQGVLVVDADTAEELTGLTQQQLLTPVESLNVLPGLRLIPYTAVGTKGFLLALRIPQVKVGRRQGAVVVAFAPQRFSKNHQALTGGNVC